jgi:hypothetical protein
MSDTLYPCKPIRMDDLFDGRLEKFGIREHVYSSLGKIRELTDGENYLLVTPYNNDHVYSFHRNMTCKNPVHHLGLRCAGCGSVQRGYRGRLVRYSVGGDVLRAIAHENRWQRALYSVEKNLGEWWMHSTGYGAWCSRVAN